MAKKSDKSSHTQQQAEATLGETNQLLQTILDHTHMLVACMDPQFNFIWVNRAYAEADERKPSFFPGKNHFDLYPNKENEEIFRRVLESGEPYFTFAKPFQYAEHPERGVSHWDWSLVPIKSANGTVVSLVLTLENVTERVRAEEKLIQARGDWERTFNAVPDLIAILDKQHRIVQINQAMASRLGCTHEQTVGLPCYQVVHGTDVPPDFCPHSKLLVDGEEHSAELREGRLDGDFLISVSPLHSPAGELIGSVHVARDITERREIERKLQESEERYRLLVEHSEDVVYSVTAEGIISFVSPQMTRFGYSPEEIVSKHFSYFVASEQRQEVLHKFETGTRAGTSFPTEFQLVGKDGCRFWVEVVGKTIFDDSGNPLLQVGVMRDITERKRAEEALRKSEEQYRSLFEHTIVGIVSSGPDDTILSANPAVAHILGYETEQEIIGKPADILWCDKEEHQQILAKTLALGRLPPFEVCLRKKGGEPVTVLATATIDRDEEGEILGSTATFTDITARKKAEQALQEAHDQLEQRVLQRTEELTREIVERKKKQEELREAELRYRTVAEFTYDLEYWQLPDGTLRFISPSCERITGYQAEEFIDHPELLDEIVVPEDKHHWHRHQQEALQERKHREIEFRIQRRDGEIRWIEHACQPVVDSQGQFLGFRASNRDITDRKQAEQRLKETEALSSTILESLSDHVAVLDPSGQIIAVNDAWRHFASENGTTDAECASVGANYLEVCRQAVRDGEPAAKAALAGIESVLGGSREKFLMEYECSSPSEQRWFVATVVPLKTPAGGAVISHRNITHRKQAEKELRDNEQRLAEAQRIAHLGSWDWNIVTNELVWSDEVYRIFGLQPQEFGATYEAFLDSVHPEDREAVKQAVNDSLANPNQPYSIEHRVVRPDGSERVVHEHGEVSFDEAGMPIRMIGTVHDITERKQAEQVRELAQRFFDLINRNLGKPGLLDQFVAEIQRYTGCEAVGIRILDDEGQIPYQAFTGFSKQFYEMESPLSLHTDKCMCINVIKGDTDPSLPCFTDGGSFCINGTTQFLATVSEKDKGETRNVCNEMGYESVALVPIFLHDKIVGLIHLADTRENMVPLNMIKVLEGVSGQLGMAIRRALAELQLRESEEKYRSLYSNMNEGMALHELICDEEGNAADYKILDVNSVYESITTIKAKTAKGSLASQVYGAEGLHYLDTYARVVASGTPTTFEMHSPTLKKHLRVSAFCPEKGKFATVFSDITELKQAEEELKKSYAEVKRLKDLLQAENIYLREEIRLEQHHAGIVGQSQAIRGVLSQVEQVAGTDSTVLITGETGTGKELLARAIHNLSQRKGRALVKVNCASLPPTLIESELFGREKGAYTGALTKQMGRFEVADGATIFLDEIGELPLDLQVKLLRVLEEGQFERLGSSETIKVDVRVIAATNRDLAKAVEEGRFREDLFHRLNVFPIHIPPLRERTEDIPALTWSFINEFAERMGKNIETIPKKTMSALQRYPWPGNVRELRNVIERSMIITRSSTLSVEAPKTAEPKLPERKTLEEMERNHIVEVLELAEGRVRGPNGAAAILGLKPTTLESKMRKLGIKRTQ